MIAQRMICAAAPLAQVHDRYFCLWQSRALWLLLILPNSKFNFLLRANYA